MCGSGDVFRERLEFRRCRAVNSLEGIHKVEASYKDNKAVVTYEPSKVKPEEIKAAIETLGYEAELEKEKQEE